MIRAALTVEEALEGMKTLEPKIKNYARLVIRNGVNVKPGQVQSSSQLEVVGWSF